MRSVLAILCLSTTVMAADPAPPAEVNKPTALPDRIILTWNADPTTSQAVTWRTSSVVDKGVAQWAVAGPNRDFVKSAQDVVAETTPFESDLGQAHYHTATIEGLQPGTKYVYRVGDGSNNWSGWNHFTTASADPEPFSFVYFGDAQNDVKQHWSRVIREAFRDAPKASFLLHAGDLINHANTDAEWGDWHRAGGWVNATVPSIATPGNHEYATLLKPPPASYRLSLHWRPQFAFPDDGPKGLEETVYSIDYQGTRIVSLNTNQYVMQQTKWLEATLADNPNRWTVVTFHHPIYSAAKGRDNPVIRKFWQPVFDKYGVDLVLQGHDHAYARTGLVVGENVAEGTSARTGVNGTVYVVSVSGPKMYDVGREPRMKRAAANTQLYQIISIDGDELRYQARTAVGELYDAFTLKKQDGKPNELIEQIPDTPERLENKKD